jgi:Methyltransferase domain
MLEYQFSQKTLENYANYGFKKVKGWLETDSALLIRQLAAAQDKLNIRGGIGEIGVHHGKLFILLHLMLRKNERSFAVDIFDKQNLNIDGSGKGNLDIFLKNVTSLGGNTNLIDIFQKSSLEVSSEEIISKAGKIRIFSIDGGHTTELTLNDLIIAEKSICEGGVIIIDDYFNPMWPGVSNGVSKFFYEQQSQIVPIVISPNKIIFTHRKYAKDYQTFFKQNLPYIYIHESVFFDSNILIYKTPKSFLEKIVKSRFYQKNKNYKFMYELIIPLIKKILNI